MKVVNDLLSHSPSSLSPSFTTHSLTHSLPSSSPPFLSLSLPSSLPHYSLTLTPSLPHSLAHSLPHHSLTLFHWLFLSHSLTYRTGSRRHRSPNPASKHIMHNVWCEYTNNEYITVTTLYASASTTLYHTRFCYHNRWWRFNLQCCPAQKDHISWQGGSEACGSHQERLQGHIWRGRDWGRVSWLKWMCVCGSLPGQG